VRAARPPGGRLARRRGERRCPRIWALDERAPGTPVSVYEELLDGIGYGAPPAERHRVGADLRHRALTSFTARRLLDGYDEIYRELAGPSVPSVPAPAPDAATSPDDVHVPTVATVGAGAVTAVS